MQKFAWVIAAIALLPAAAAAAQPHPDISGVWTRGAAFETGFQAPPSGPGPVANLSPAAPDIVPGQTLVHWQGDPRSPILQPWAAAIVREHADADRANMPFRSAQETCTPMGVPYILQLNGHIEIGDDGKQIVFMHEPHMQPRIVRLNVAHPAHPKPSWLGDSVAHWEGDTLVVDTIGVDRRTWVDVFGTPHTEKLHVVERYRRTGPNRLEVALRVEDPGAFTTPWSAVLAYRKDANPYLEVVCAENNRDAETGGTYPIPVAAKPDF